jgi:hypothetical protein
VAEMYARGVRHALMSMDPGTRVPGPVVPDRDVRADWVVPKPICVPRAGSGTCWPDLGYSRGDPGPEAGRRTTRRRTSR